MSKNIETHQQEISKLTSTDEVPLPSNDQLVNDSTAQQLQSDLSNNNLTTQLEPQRDVTINVDDRFGQSCASILSEAQIVNNIIQESIKLDRQRWLYLFIPSIPPLIIMSVCWIIWVTTYDSSVPEKKTSGADLLFIAILLTDLNFLLLCLALVYGAKYYWNRNKYAMLQSNVRLLIKLEGDQWIRYVEYLYGLNRKGFWYFGPIGALTFCLCRMPHYKKLIARGYGYIVLCEQGFILDEMTFVVRNRTHHILAVSYVANMGLRVYLLRKNATYKSYESEREALKKQTVPLDILLPNIPQNMAVLLGLQIQYGL